MPCSNYVSSSLCVAILPVKRWTIIQVNLSVALRYTCWSTPVQRSARPYQLSTLLDSRSGCGITTRPPRFGKPFFVNIFFTSISLTSGLLLILALTMSLRLLLTPFRVDWDADEYQRTYFEI